MRRNQNISSHAVGQRSQCDDNFTSHDEEVSQIPDHLDSQTDPNILQESSILCSRRPTPYKPYNPGWAATGLSEIPILRAFQLNSIFSMAKETSDASSSTNNIRREVVEQEQRQSKRDYPAVISPIIYKLYDPRWTDIGLPVDPVLRALELNPNFAMPKATSDEISSANNLRREVVEQEQRQSKRDYPGVISPVPYKLYDPRWNDVGLPVDPILRALGLNPNLAMPKATSDEISTANNLRTDHARSKVPKLHESSSPSGREVVEKEHRQSKRGYPGVISPTPYTLYDPRWADIGLPVDPILRAYKLNPDFLFSIMLFSHVSNAQIVKLDHFRLRPFAHKRIVMCLLMVSWPNPSSTSLRTELGQPFTGPFHPSNWLASA
ncbi:putative mediator of RNA polymerase II transcription subunit 37a-like [Capsicum annuum]|nr:putative mediator of RNA polymerase II transcription subunit 37a-like [Capsicum annuum]